MSHLKPGENANNVSEKEWKERLTAQQFEVLREKGTEKPFSGKYYSHKETGVYHCAVCNNRLFKCDEYLFFIANSVNFNIFRL